MNRVNPIAVPDSKKLNRTHSKVVLAAYMKSKVKKSLLDLSNLSKDKGVVFFCPHPKSRATALCSCEGSRVAAGIKVSRDSMVLSVFVTSSPFPESG
ncbi:hypothetical protein DIPPA_05651 [Diplonema papillatum]|nr:hypothetical protein DIPPA_05651 [Diplonema papillatum]